MKNSINIRTFFNGSVKLITPEVFNDNRGEFSEVYNYELYKKRYKIKDRFIQDNVSHSKYKYTIRGMHLQKKPFEQSKLVFVIKGSIIDFFVDLRKNSKTFGQYGSVKLKSSNKQLLYIQKGFAHGFKTIESNTAVMYKVSNYYSPKNEVTLNYLDKIINIDWKLNNNKVHLSPKDLKGISLDNVMKKL